MIQGRTYYNGSGDAALQGVFLNVSADDWWLQRNRIETMDRKTLEFVTYCIAKLSAALKLPQQEVYRRLKSSGILYGYIVPSYDVLHTFSSRYLMEDLTEYMKEKGVLDSSYTVNMIKETSINHPIGWDMNNTVRSAVIIWGKQMRPDRDATRKQINRTHLK